MSEDKRLFQWTCGSKCRSPRHRKRNWQIRTFHEWELLGMPPYATEGWILDQYCDCKLTEVKPELMLDPNAGQ